MNNLRILEGFNSVFEKFYTVRNPVQFWSRWNPSRVKLSLLIYRWLRKRINFSIKIPFIMFIFAFWGFTDDIFWALIKLLSGSIIFPFWFWTVNLAIQSLVVILYKRLPDWLPRLPSIIAIPITHIYVIGSIRLVDKYLF